MTCGKGKIFYISSDSGEIIHTSYVIPRCFKFPFLKNNEYEIGPCFTYPKYRGRGIYPKVLQHICGIVNDSKAKFYMIVDEQNIPSIKGIEKAGFEKIGTVSVSRVLKIYRKDSDRQRMI